MFETRSYIDVTKDWKEQARLNVNNDVKVFELKINDHFNHKGIGYIIDGKRIVLDYSEEELNFAEWVKSTFNEDVKMMPRIKGDPQTADYIFKGEYWDLKTIESKNNHNALFNNIRNKEKQSHNFMFDLTYSEMEYEEFMKGVNSIFFRDKTAFVDKVLIKKGSKWYVYARK